MVAYKDMNPTKNMKILSIETSCDETAVAVLDASKNFDNARFIVLGNALYSQAEKHAVYGGVYPTLAKREHASNLVPLLETALKEAELYHKNSTELSQEQKEYLKKLLQREEELLRTLLSLLKTIDKPEVDAIAVTQGPGLEPALWVGINFAKALSYIWNLPILPVNHLEGHIIASSVEVPSEEQEMFFMQKIKFPILGLIISGGHTEFVYTEKWGDYKVVGATRDDSLGEAFDKVARLLGIPYPGGPELSRLADLGRQALLTRPAHLLKDMKKLPRPMIHSEDLDFSFSGLKTAVLYEVQKIGELNEMQKKLFAAEFEEAITDVILKKFDTALLQYPANTIILGGGVSANKYIRARLAKKFSKEKTGHTLCLPAKNLSTDNAVMIGIAGYFMHLRNEKKLNATDNLSASGNMCLNTKNT